MLFGFLVCSLKFLRDFVVVVFLNSTVCKNLRDNEVDNSLLYKGTTIMIQEYRRGRD